MMFELLIQNGNTVYQPILEGDIKWETDRKGQPGKLTFSVVSDGRINFTEGNAVSFKVDGLKVFYGFVFKKERDKDMIIKVTAYDQLRYLKNKASYSYSNKTAKEVIQMLASQFGLVTGYLENTEWIIPQRIESNTPLIDMMLNALDLTLQNKGKLYVLYDDFGKITLKNVEDMKLDLLVDNSAAENFKYSSSIDGETFNRIKLYNKETQETIIAKDDENIKTWGLLQYFDHFDVDDTNVKAKADALLKLYNAKQRSLSISNAFGDTRVRAGSSIPIDLNLGDVVAKNYMVVEKVSHTFSKDNHVMNLTLKGGVINA